MLKLTNFKLNDSHLHMNVLIEGDENKCFELCIDKDKDMFPVISSTIPAEYRIYEQQARIALRRYIGKALPATVTSSWY